MKKVRVVSLFSGCGGGDLGLLGGFEFLGKTYKRLPFEILWANDNEEFAVETYRKNFNHAIVCENIQKIHSSDIPEHDLLIGGFPCQTFSMVGQRKGFEDPRGLLYKEMIKVMKIKRPKVFIGENVKGLMSIGGGSVFQTILKDFELAGYDLFHSVLDASNYGVPQKRQRVIIVGIRKDLKLEFKFPSELKAKTSLGMVVEKNEEVDSKYYFSNRALEGLKKANKAFNKGRAQKLEEPCNTISTHLAKVSLNGTDPVLMVKPDVYRRLTPKEAARIQSFPENFEFIGTDSKKYIQIGNAIPPVLMWYIGNEIYNQVFSYGHVHNTKKNRNYVKDSLEKHPGRKDNLQVAKEKQNSLHPPLF